jgi:hypothetical protein
MPTSTFTKFQCFVEDLAEGKHNLGSDTLKVALTNTAPNASTNTVIGNITEISYANIQNGGTTGRNLSVSSSAQSSGTYKLVIADLTLTATGTVPTFRYAVIYNDTAAGDNLIGFYDYGAGVDLANGETMTLDFDGTNGVLQLA